jgi:hypothetical protein
MSGRRWSNLRRLTFELKPTTEVGSVSLDCDDASWPQARLTLPAVVGRRLEPALLRELRQIGR